MFPFLFEDRYRRAARPFGIRPEHTGAEVRDTELTAWYGRWHIATSLTNIARVTITGPYLFVKTAGPPRLGLTDRGLTFASNGRRGVQFDFHEPIRCVGPIRHPNLTLTVSDCAGLRRATDPSVR